MIGPEKKLTGSAAKVKEYVDRIRNGESRDDIMKGLTDSFRTAIEAELNPEKDNETESEKTVLLAKEARRETQKMAQEDEINSANRANEIRTELGLPIQPVEQGEKKSEKEELFKEQVNDFLQLAIKDKDFKRTMDNYRNIKLANESDEDFKKRQSLSDIEMLSKMPGSMYELIHKSGMSYQEVTDGINIPDKEEFIKNFNDEISNKLVEAVAKSSKVRHITEQELTQNGQPDQAMGFVWFKGNALRPANAREVRFYINASPNGTSKVAEYLSKISDQLDQYGLRLQFKFRKDLGEYDRTDTCVAYLYMPKAETAEQKANSDLWLERIKDTVAQIPKDAIRDKNSFFTDKISEGISFAEDSRDTGSKGGESYTSQITKTIAESAGDLGGQFRDLTPEAIGQITQRAIEKLKVMNYF